jgi:hypothetical protein
MKQQQQKVIAKTLNHNDTKTYGRYIWSLNIKKKL